MYLFNGMSVLALNVCHSELVARGRRTMGTATTESMTSQQLKDELQRLEGLLGMPVDVAEHLAAADALDADLYQVLRRIRDLRWLQSA